MFNLNKEIQNWKKSLHKNPSLEDGYINELESHLRDKIEDYTNKGMSEKEAFEKAKDEIGEPEKIGAEFFKTDTTNKISGKPNWKSPAWMPELIWSYFKSASRNLKRNFSFASINILGLAISIACGMVILFYVINELSYESSFENSDSIYRVVNTRVRNDKISKNARTPVPFGPSLKFNLPEIKESARFWRGFLPVIGRGTNYFDNEKIYFADKTALKIFNFNFISGNPATALDNPSSVILNQSLANKLFGDENPIGKSIEYRGYPAGELKLSVTGIIKDLADNTHLDFSALISLSGVNTEKDNWGSFKPIWTYVLLPPDVNISFLEKKINNYTQKHFSTNSSKIDFLLEKINNIHLYSDFKDGFKEPGSITNIYLFSAIGILILLIGCANFINLSTSRTLSRAREVGIRKVLGAGKKQLIYQFQIESLIIFFIATLVGLVLFEVIKPFISKITGADYSLNFLFQNGIFIYLVLFGILISILSALYPSITLSNFNPINALRQKIFTGKEGNTLRYVLVVFQFTVTIFLITSAVILNSQLDYIFNKKLGFNKNNIVVVPYSKNFNGFKNNLLSNSSISSMAVSSRVPVSDVGYDGRRVNVEGSGDEVQIQNYLINSAFTSTYNIKVIAGRNLRKDSEFDKASLLINETAVRKLGYSSPQDALRKKIYWDSENYGTIVGVVNDFFTTSFHEEIPPVIMHTDYSSEYWKTFISIKISSKNLSNNLALIEKSWKKFNPDNAYNYFFIDESLAQLHQEDEKFRDSFNYLSMLAVFVACLGLFGLISFLTNKRKKEIGIRKVFGSSSIGIIILLLKNIFISLFISACIAVPFTYFLNQKWLSDFSYRISINAGMFLISFGIVILIALLTTAYRVIKVALSNPVDSIRYE